MKRIYLVVNPERIAFHPPTFIHEFLATAQTEAKRLAAENPGQIFHVVASVEASRKVDVHTHVFDDDFSDASEVPF